VFYIQEPYPRPMKYTLPFFAIVLFFLSVGTRADATVYYSRASGPWTSSSTWSLSSGGAAISSGFPGTGDDVIIEGGYTVTIAASGVENVYAASVVIGGSSSSGTLSYPVGNPPSSLTITGDLTIGGSGASATGTLTYGSWGLTITCARLLKGTGAANRTNALQQDFTFTGSFTLPTGFNQFRNFIVAGGTVTLSENIETNGSVSPAINAGSTLNLQTYTINIGGYKNFNINGTLIVGGNSGGFSNSNFPNTFTNLTIGNNSTVVYSYAGAQTIYPATYQNLTLSGSGAKTTGYVGYVSGLTLTNGGSGYYCDATLDFIGGGGTGATGSGGGFGDPGDPISYLSLGNRGSGYTSAPTVVINGDCGGSGATATATITTFSNATVNGKLSLGGSATLAGTALVYGASGSLEYAGTAAQTTGAEFPGVWSGSGGIAINNSNGVTLSAAKTISSTLTLTNGILTTSSSHLLTISNTAASAITGGSATSFINGPVLVTLAPGLAGATSYTFPVGKATAYMPLVLVNPSTLGGVVTATAEAFTTNSGGSADGSGVLSVSHSEYWSLGFTGNFMGSSMSLTRPAALGVINLVAKSSTVNGVYSSLGGTVSGTSVINSNNIGGGAAAAFYVMASSNSLLLPVTLVDVAAFVQQGGIQVKWTSSNEINMSRYEVEKSIDGQQFYKTGSVASNGNSNFPVEYHWLDANAAYGNNYYRVKAIGANGGTEYSKVVKAAISGPSMHATVYPNPVKTSTLYLQVVNLEKGIYRVTLSNQLGQQVYSNTIGHSGGSAVFSLQPGQGFIAGIYQVQLSGNGKRETQTILKY